MELVKKLFNRVGVIIMGIFIDFVRNYSSFRPYIKGDKRRLRVGKRVSLVNTIINVSSGDVEIGNDTVFGHNCILATGFHEFQGGMRKKIYHRKNYGTDISEVPTTGHDIKIGSGCWITSNVTIVGGVTIGDNSIVMSGAVVTKNMPSSVVIGGVPARIVKRLK